jgi:hypothetical protein
MLLQVILDLIHVTLVDLLLELVWGVVVAVACNHNQQQGRRHQGCRRTAPHQMLLRVSH